MQFIQVPLGMVSMIFLLVEFSSYSYSKHSSCFKLICFLKV